MKRWFLCALALATIGCTDAQLDYLGITDPGARETLLALPDAPMDVGHGIVDGDGTYNAKRCGEVPASYRLFDPGPAMQAFGVITCQRGWAKADTLAWATFAEGVMKRESGFCPALFRGGRPDADCNIIRQGKHQDAGFAQVIWKYAPWLGPNENIWSKWDIIATPERSMTAFVALIEHSGRQPWCWTAKLRRGAVCQSAP